jgi:hypothetical protein
MHIALLLSSRITRQTEIWHCLKDFFCSSLLRVETKTTSSCGHELDLFLECTIHQKEQVASQCLFLPPSFATKTIKSCGYVGPFPQSCSHQMMPGKPVCLLRFSSLDGKSKYICIDLLSCADQITKNLCSIKPCLCSAAVLRDKKK